MIAMPLKKDDDSNVNAIIGKILCLHFYAMLKSYPPSLLQCKLTINIPSNLVAFLSFFFIPEYRLVSNGTSSTGSTFT